MKIRREPEWAGKTGFGGHFRRIMVSNTRWVIGMMVSYFLPPIIGAVIFVNVFVDEAVVEHEEVRREIRKTSQYTTETCI